MSRYLAVPVFALTALVAACGRPERSQTTSSSAGASTPVVSGSKSVEDSSSEGNVEVAPVTYARAESTFGAGNYQEATELFSHYTVSHPENPWGYYMVGVSAWKSGSRDQALAAFDKSIELDPNHRKSLYNSSRVLLELGRPQEALDRIEKALSQEPASGEGLRLLGRTRYLLGQVDEAIAAYQKALVTDDQDVWAMNNLGLIYLDQNRPWDALAPLARAVQLRSRSPVFQNNLGSALERSGYPEAAARAYEAAIGVDSTYQKASVSLARVTAAGPTAESQAVDLDELAQQFENQIESWRGAVASMTDSTTASIEAKTDTLEDGVNQQ